MLAEKGWDGRYVLVKNDVGAAPVTEGAKLVTLKGDHYTLSGGEAPHKAGSTGKIYVLKEGATSESSFFPSVCGLRWKKV